MHKYNFPSVKCTNTIFQVLNAHIQFQMHKYNLHAGMRHLAFLLLVLMADGEMGIVFSLAEKIPEICLLKDVSANKGGMCTMCIGRTLGGDLNFQDQRGEGDCVKTSHFQNCKFLLNITTNTKCKYY